MVPVRRTKQPDRLERRPFGPCRDSVLAAALLFAAASPSAAQTVAPKAATSTWEIDAMAGVGRSTGGNLQSTFATFPSSPQFPAPGSAIPNVQPVSTWFLSASGPFVLSGIQPLTPVVRTPNTSGHLQGLIGAHVTRWVSPHLAFEFAATYTSGAPTQLSGATHSAIEQSRASFVTTFDALFARSPASYNAATVAATTSSAQNAGGELQVGGAVMISKGTGRLRPYLAAGVGERGTIGATQTVLLTGNYSFLALGGVPINETDSVAMHYSSGHSLAPEVGVGLRQFVTARSGVRLELRGLFSHPSDQLSIDISPSPKPGTPAGFFVQPIVNGSNETLVFSNTPAQQTSLSGPPVTNLTTATGTGWRWTWLATVAWFWRF